jgi:hypothetical protein
MDLTTVLPEDRAQPSAALRAPLSGVAATRPQLRPIALTGWDRAAIAFFTLAAIAIAAGGFYLSFDAVSSAMRATFGTKAFLVPIIVDSSIFAFSGIDVVLARLRIGHPLVRLVPLGGTAATVWLNVSAGGGGGAIVAHACMPSVFVAFAEVCRHVVRRRAGLAAGATREGIPLARWLVDPVRSLLLWRRMVLWDIRSFDLALEREFRRLEVIAAMRDAYGLVWRWKTGGHARLGIRLGLLDVSTMLGPTPTNSPGPQPGAALAARAHQAGSAPPLGANADTHAHRPPKAQAPGAPTPGGSEAERPVQEDAPGPNHPPGQVGDRRDSARWVYNAFRDAHRELPARLYGELSGYSYWQARRLLEVFGREIGPIVVTERSDGTAFTKEISRRMGEGLGGAPPSGVGAPAFAT